MSNIKHDDYGRVIPNARKDLYSKGKLTTKNFLELNDDEQLEQITKDAIWKINFKELKEMGFSPYGAFILKRMREMLASKPNGDFYIGKITGDFFIDKKMINYIYVWFGNKFKNNFENTIVKTPNDFLSSLNNFFPQNQFNFLLIENRYRYYSTGYQVTENDKEEIFDMLNIVFPQYKEKILDLINYRNGIFLQNILNSFYSNRIKNLRQPFDISKKEEENASLYGWTKLIKDEIIINENLNITIDNISNSPDLFSIDNIRQVISLINSTKLRIRKKGLISFNVKNYLEQKHLSSITRSGYDFLKDKPNVDAELLENDFGFNGTQWGEWVKGKNERQNILNLTYYSFCDLAKTLNIPLSKISLDDGNQKLALAFGSQGKKNAQAFFNFNHKFFHFNRLNGYGSIAHEWFHAYDNFLYQKALNNGFISSKLHEETYNLPFFSYLIEKIIQKNKYKYYELVHDDDYINLKNFDKHMVDLVSDFILPKMLSISNNNIEHHEIIENPNNFYDKNILSEESLMFIFDTSISNLKTYFHNLNFLLEIDDFSSRNYLMNKSTFGQTLSKFLSNDTLYLNCFDKDAVYPYEKYKEEILKEVFVGIHDFNKKFFNSDTINKKRIDFNKSLVELVETYVDKFNKKIDDNELDINNQINELLKNDKITINCKGYNDRKLENILEPYRKETTKEMLAGLSSLIKEYSEDLPLIVKKSLLLCLNSNLNSIGNSLLFFFEGVGNQRIAKYLINNNKEFQINVKSSNFYNLSLLMDGNAEPYFSTTYEMFARAGEMFIGTKTLNSCLSDASFTYESPFKNLLYPRGVEFSKFSQLIEKSVKHHIEEDFDVDLSLLPYIENQYDVVNETIKNNDNDINNSETVKRKRGRPRKQNV